MRWDVAAAARALVAIAGGKRRVGQKNTGSSSDEAVPVGPRTKWRRTSAAEGEGSGSNEVHGQPGAGGARGEDDEAPAFLRPRWRIGRGNI